MHSGVCLYTRRLRWCKLLFNTLFSLRAKALSPPPPFDSPATSCQLYRRPLGFASPPHDGFALLASAHTDAHALLRTHHTKVRSPTQYSLVDVFCM